MVACGSVVAQRGSTVASSFRHERRYNAESIECQNVTEITFVGVFPCIRKDSKSESERLSECDLLAEAAANLAIERVNRDPDILPNITLKLSPLYVSNSKVRHAKFITVLN